jgi:hypothetical protein
MPLVGTTVQSWGRAHYAIAGCPCLLVQEPDPLSPMFPCLVCGRRLTPSLVPKVLANLMSLPPLLPESSATQETRPQQNRYGHELARRAGPRTGEGPDRTMFCSRDLRSGLTMALCWQSKRPALSRFKLWQWCVVCQLDDPDPFISSPLNMLVVQQAYAQLNLVDAWPQRSA